MKGSAGSSIVGLEGEAGSSGTVTMSKKAKKLTYEKQLEEINKELQLKSSTSNPWKMGAGVKRQRMKPEQEVMLLEQKWILLLKLKRHTEVIDDGYSILGRMGPIVVIYKCMLIALVRLGKTEDDLVELLEAWKKAAPKCPHFAETKRIFDGYFAALRSGMKHSDIFSSIEDALGLNANLVLSKHSADVTDEDKKWRFRAPPPRHTTFSLCPRCSSGNSCIYGDDCLFAHSNEELKEWKMRAEGDKKNNNNPHLEEDPEEHSNKSSGKKRQIPNSYRHLLIPPLCIHYLQELGKHIKEATDVKNVLTDDINGAKFKVAPALHFQRRLDGVNKVQCTWSFMVISKMPMGTVTILHDANRERFRISAATFYNKKKETIDLIDLHPNNKVQTKLQVLNTFIQPPLFLRFNSGWPDTCYYKIEVTYETRDPFPEPGLFRQSIVFDFKKEPKVAKHISIEILPKVEPIGNHLTEANRKTVWGVSPPSISPIDFNSNSEFSSSGHIEDKDSPVTNSTPTYEPEPDEFINRSSDFPSLDQCLAVKVNGFNSKSVGGGKAPPTDFIFDSETGKVVTVKGVPLRLACEGESVFRNQENIFLDDVPLTKENYCTWMRDFLEVELKARQRVVGDLKKVVEIRILGEYTTTPECLYKYDSTVGEVYGKIEALSSIFSGDTKLERLLGLNCSNVVISDPGDKAATKRFLCKIIEKSNSVLVLAIGRKAADELLLLSNTTRQLQIQFILDPVYIDRVKRSLEVLNKYHMDFLFPSFDSELFPFLKTVEGVGMIYQEEQSLNARQLNVYNLLIGRKVLIDGMARPPPLLLLGGVSTGKSFIIAQCIRALVRPCNGVSPNRILICTQTDFAADAYITDYLHPWLINDQLSIQRSKPLRIYSEDRFVDSVSGVLKHYCLFNHDGSFRYPTLEEIIAHTTIIVTLSTCAELIRLGCDGDTFSHIMLDEVGPCLEAEYVQPIVLAGRDTKLLIAGDVMRTKSQMFSVSKGVPPLSLLERLRNIYTFRHPYVVNLVDNYVNHEVIVKFLSEVYYYNQLRSASSQPSHPRHYPLSFHHVISGRELQADNGRGCYNMEEIRHIVEFVEELFRTWPDTWGSPKLSSNVVIFTPYHNQVLGLKVQLQLKGIHEVDVKLLSHIPGAKYKVVIISTVRTYKQNGGDVLDGVSDGGFFTDRRLLFNVIGCARNMVVAFGDAVSLWNHGACSDIWQKYLSECHHHNSIKGFKAQTGQHLKTEDGFIIGAPLPTRQQEKVLSAAPVPVHVRATAQPPPKSCSTQSIGQATLIHAQNISPSHGLEFSVNGIDSSPININNDHSWNIPSSSMQAPKSDLFSAFSGNMEPLYNSRSPLTLSQDANMIGKLPVPDKFLGKGFEDNSIQGSVFKPLTLNGMSNPLVRHTPEPKIENVGHRFSGMKFEYQQGSQSNLNKPMEVYRSPFQLPSVSPTSIFEERQPKFQGVIGTPSKPEEKMLNVSEPKTTPRPLFDKNFMFDNSDSHFSPVVAPKPVYESRRIPPLTTFENSLMTPVHKGPPGFAPISSLESKIGNFSYPENKLSYSSPQHKATHGSGLTSTKSYRRNVGFEVPPRMLKNLHLSTPTNYRSPTRNKGRPPPIVKAPPPPEMNFFEELGLSEQPQADEDISRCESAASSTDDHSFIDGDIDETVLVVENLNNDSEGLLGRDEWIQVKNSKKGKHNQQQHQATRKSRASKQAANRVNGGAGGETSAEVTSELHLDDKVELISQMGYPRALAIKALQLCDKDLAMAADWVVSNYGVSSS